MGQAPARVRHAPRTTHANDWAVVSDISATLGIELDEWQEDVLQAAMGVRRDGRWATPQVGLSTPRQNGKSQLIVARALAGVLAFDEKTIIVSAHQQDTAREVFTRIVDLIEANPPLESRVASVIGALNREQIRFKSGQQIRFKARSTGGGRGFSSDCLLLDEAQILSPSAWSAILPTMSARPNPQVWLLGTPPTPVDDGEVFGRFRDAGLAAKESRLAYLEWSAESGDDFDDEETWRKSNPSYGTRIDYDAIAGERATMSDAQFAMERLGMWSGSSSDMVIDEVSWALRADPASMATDLLTLAIDVAPDRSTAAVSIAGLRPDGSWHVALDEHRKGADWVAGWVKARTERNKLHAVVVDELSGLVEKRKGRNYLMGTDVEVTLAASEGRDMAVACGRYFDGIMHGTLWHTDQPQVNVALSVARKRVIGSAWGWNRKDATSDITPIVSQTLALWGAQNSTVKRPARATAKRKVVVYT